MMTSKRSRSEIVPFIDKVHHHAQMRLSCHTLWLEDLTIMPDYIHSFHGLQVFPWALPSVFIPMNPTVLCPLNALREFTQLPGMTPGYRFFSVFVIKFHIKGPAGLKGT